MRIYEQHPRSVPILCCFMIDYFTIGTHHVYFDNFFYETYSEMRPYCHRFHVFQIEHPHVAQRQFVLTEQPAPHHFAAFQLTVGAERFRVCFCHSVTRHSAQVRVQFRHRKHVAKIKISELRSSDRNGFVNLRIV